MGDFLRKHASTSLVEDFVACGVPFRISTNSELILQAARQSFSSAAEEFSGPEFSMRFWVDPDCNASRPWPRPHLHGLGNLVYAGFDVGSFAVVDLDSRRIIGRFSPEMAADTPYWNRSIFPMLMSVIGASVGITELHCACVEREDCGLLLVGPSGSGKSTLTLTLASLGFGFLSDDRTFCSIRKGGLRAWGSLAELKLRNEAATWFSKLSGTTPNNGDGGLRFSPEDSPDLRRSRECEPQWIVFLEPQQSAGFQHAQISPEEAAKRLRKDLMAESAEAAHRQDAVISELIKVPSSILRYSNDPWVVAQRLASTFKEIVASESPQSVISRTSFGDESAATTSVSACFLDRHAANCTPVEASASTDPLGRFRSMKHTVNLPVMGRTIRVETDSADLFQRIAKLLSVYPPTNERNPDFRWRIVHQTSTAASCDSFRRLAFSDPGLRFIQIGQRTFSIVDLESRLAVASVTDEMINDDLRFTVSFLDSLFCITASSLGLVSLFSNCVSHNGRGALILGSPGSGKTTASYAAARRGMHLLADEGVFLDTRGGELRAWGGFWPVVFRKEGGRFLPELEKCARQFHYGELSYYHLDQSSFQNPQAFAVEPVCSIFLDRQESSSVRIAKIGRPELPRRLAHSLLFEEEDRFHRQQEKALEAVAKVPSYKLTYGPDPADAAAVIQELLGRNSGSTTAHPRPPAAAMQHSGIVR